MVKSEEYNLIVYEKDSVYSSFVCPLSLNAGDIMKKFPYHILSVKKILITELTERNGKYKAIKCQDSQGRIFDSKLELVVYHEYEVYEEMGLISNMDRQIPFSFAKFNIKNTYRPDMMFKAVKNFSVASIKKPVKYVSGETYVADVKSPGTRRDPVFSYKKGLMKTFWNFDVSVIVRQFKLIKSMKTISSL